MSAILDFRSESASLQSFVSTGLSVQEKKLKIDFQDSHHSGTIGFLIRIILAFLFIYKSPRYYLSSS